MSKLTEKIRALAEPVVLEEGCSLWDVEYVREAGSWYLRLYIDKEGGVGIDDCERIKRHFHGVLETRDIMNPAMSIWGFLFTQTTPEHKEELQEILHSTLEEFMV